jgi:hypothetical protein
MREHPVRFYERLRLKRRGLLTFLQSRCGCAYGDHERSAFGLRNLRHQFPESGHSTSTFTRVHGLVGRNR